jgi:hypothetical protein
VGTQARRGDALRTRALIIGQNHVPIIDYLHMSVIYIYRGSGRFGGGAFEWNNPPLASKHEFMLFLLQDKDEAMQQAAHAEVDRFGFKQVRLFPGKKIVVEALNDPAMAEFRKNYQDALKDGSSLVWYP